MLKTLGFTRPQISIAVVWQSTTLVVVALVVGLPIGVASGRWLWSGFARQVGVAPDPLTPLKALLLTIPTAIMIANIVATVPAWTAAQVPPNRGLRAE
jgi:ABC-type lipoprotein release transport system permease subunit